MPRKKSKKTPATPLEAVEACDLSRLRALLKGGADVNESEEDTALSKAAEMGRNDMVQALLKAGADPDFGGIWVPLCRAVSSGDIKTVKLLIAAKAKVDAQEEDGTSALMLASANGDLPMVKLLIASGASPKLQDEDGESAIIKARDFPAIVEFLKPLSAKVDVKAAIGSKSNSSARIKELVEVAKAGDVARVKRLIADGLPVDGVGDEGETALYAAVYAGRANVVEVLLDAGAEVDAKDRYGRTPLSVAARSGQVSIAERLLAAGAGINVRETIEGKTPFLACIGRTKNQRDMMRLLSKHGADLTVRDSYHRTALALAIRDLGNSPEADDEKRRDRDALRETFIELGILHPQANALTEAAGNGELETIRRLIESGTPVDAYDEQERTALYMAVSRRRHEIVSCLLAFKPDLHKAIGYDRGEDVQWGGIDRPCPWCETVFTAIERQRKCPSCGKEFDAHEAFGHNLSDHPAFVSWSNGFVPLMAAAKLGDTGIANALLDGGADANLGKDGITPLMTACFYDHIELAKLLIERGADVRRETKSPNRLKEKISPVLIAAKRKNLALIQLLWKAGVPAKDKKPTLLVDAARRGDVSQIDSLLREGASAAAEDPLTGEEPLAAAAKMGHADAVRRLIKAGAAVNPLSPRKIPALLLVAEGIAVERKRGKISASEIECYVATAKSLIESGAKVNVSFFGIRPLDHAKEANCRSLVELLEEAARKETKKK